MLNLQVHQITSELRPLVRQSSLTSGGLSIIDSPLNFVAVSTGTTVRFTWDSVVGAAQYEVRKGADWDTANFQFRITGLLANIDPLVYGSHQFLIKSLTSGGNYSLESSSLIFVVPQIDAVTISQTVIDNNVLLSWAPPASTFNIAHYKILKDGVLTGTVNSTFITFFEAVSGDFIYSVIAVDIAGNEGTEATVEVHVNQPPDFELQDSRVSTLLGTRVNVILEEGPKLLCCWLATTWTVHFTGHAWLSPQNQVDAGYPIYIQPSNTTGSYQEVFDYGTVISNVIVSVTWNTNVITPVDEVSVLVRMAVSNDNITYSAFTNGSSQYFPGFRYLKLKLEFTGVNDKALIEIYNLTINLNVKREVDGGEVLAVSTDVGGTEVLFNKAFKDIESLTATVQSLTEPYITIYDFVDIPDPVHFFVYAFDTTGNRVTKLVSWKARGIV